MSNSPSELPFYAEQHKEIHELQLKEKKKSFVQEFEKGETLVTWNHPAHLQGPGRFLRRGSGRDRIIFENPDWSHVSILNVKR